ncbi:MAG: hypothetical protein C0406_04520 [Sideroxydans sp.]|nr:hypothetical protein [Sideroxydans sp.]
MITGKLRIIGQIDVVEEDQPSGQYGYKRALLIEFDNDEAIRQAIKDEGCHFTFGEPDEAGTPAIERNNENGGAGWAGLDQVQMS